MFIEFSPWRHNFPNIPLCPWRHKCFIFPFCPWRYKFDYKHATPPGSGHNILTPEGSHVYNPLCPWRHNFPNIIYFVSARVNILFQTIPLDGLPSRKDIHINNGFPTTCVSGTNPQKRLSSELCLLSPIIQ